LYTTAQNSYDIFPLDLQTIIIAQMMSTGGERRGGDFTDYTPNIFS